MNLKTIGSLFKSRVHLILFAVFVWLTGAFLMHSLMASHESERLRENLKLSQSLVINRLHLLQLELGQTLSKELASEASEGSEFLMTALVKQEDRHFVLDQVFQKAKEFDQAYLAAQLESQGNVTSSDRSKSYLWVDRGPGKNDYLFALLPYQLEGRGLQWGLAVSKLPSSWLQFSGSKSLFLIDQRSEKIISAYGGMNQGGQLSSDFNEASSSDVSAVRLTSKEGLAWQDVPATNLTLVYRESRPDFFSGVVIWGLLCAVFLLGMVLMMSDTKLVAAITEPEEEKFNLREEEEELEQIGLDEMIPIKTRILTAVDDLGPPPAKKIHGPIESVVEDQLLESVFLKKVTPRGHRLLDGVEDIVKNMAAEIQSSEVRVNVLIPEELISDWPQTQLRTVVEEIVRNSLESMESSETKTLTFSAESKGDFIQLIVEDTGSGMTDEVLERSLEAFFSTKPSLNKRRGLGLNVAKRLLEISGGKIYLESTPAVGTKVIMTFRRENLDHEVECE